MKTETRKIMNSMGIPALFVMLMWLGTFFDISVRDFGIMPRTMHGMIGIVTTPFVHSGYMHLISNSVPILLLGSGIIYFYRSLSFRVLLLVYLLSGFWVWLSGRPSYHIGASGLVYGFAAFVFFSGILRGNRRLLAFSLLVAFLYGSMIWGVLPIETGMSWEAHLFGALSGVMCAFFFRNEGPKKEQYSWELDNEPEDDHTEGEWMASDEEPSPETKELEDNLPETETRVNYIYHPSPPPDQTPSDERDEK
jgi:membrane associated rhomboid family serine protease